MNGRVILIHLPMKIHPFGGCGWVRLLWLQSVGSVDQQRGCRRQLVSSRVSGPAPDALDQSHFDKAPGDVGAHWHLRSVRLYVLNCPFSDRRKITTRENPCKANPVHAVYNLEGIELGRACEVPAGG